MLLFLKAVGWILAPLISKQAALAASGKTGLLVKLFMWWVRAHRMA